MSLANKFTLLRIILAPVFFLVFVLFGEVLWTIPILWLIFIFAELTDYFDGHAARKLNETSDFGKFFDPFADTLMQLTCFLCFVVEGLFPAFLFLLVIYREFGILFVRNLMLKKGVTMGARISGKVKTVFYIIAASVALAAVTLTRLNVEVLNFLTPYFRVGALVFFIVSVIISIISFFDYVLVYRKTTPNAS